MAAKPEEIGLLVVHGMGEQEKLEHLKATARELASFIAGTPGLVRLSTADNSQAKAPAITIDAAIRQPRAVEHRQIRLHLHEVWWADLGIAGGFLDHAKFWLWGLGQWAAEALRKGIPYLNTEQLMAMPQFSYQDAPHDRPGFLRELPSRVMLFGAALLAILTFFTWSAAKQIVALLARRLPEPSLIFLFLGDVKIYERPGGPGKGTLLDPDLPMRATIRRRMVSAMTAMAVRPYDRWYILAHSLGTVPAFNALQETELALPNYLTRADWEALPDSFKTQAPFTPAGAKPTTDVMMPRRPPWLSPTDGIDRRRLFERFAGFVTYGCPLDKFAALWPRVVPLNRQARVFPGDSEWINLHDPTDPVAARLDAFQPPKNQADTHVRDRIALVPQNFPCRASLIFALSHVRYLRPRRRGPRNMAAALAEAIVSGGQTKLSEAAAGAKASPAEAWARMFWAIGQVTALGLFLTTAAAALLIAIGKTLSDRASAMVGDVIAWICPTLLAWLQAGGCLALWASAAIVLALALAVIVLAGIARMIADIFRPRRR